MKRRVSPLKLEIVKRGMLQADVAAEAGMSETKLSRFVNGRARPSQREIEELAQVLRLNPEDLPV